jgi:hypothetical protein
MTNENVVSLVRLREVEAELGRKLDALEGQTARSLTIEELESLMAAKSKAGEAQLVAFRFNADLLTRLAAHVDRMKAATPGVEFTKSDAVRVLLLQSLDAAEKAADKRGRGK